MTAITPIDLFTILKEKIGEPQAKMLTEYVAQQVEASFDQAKEHLATKEDLARETGLLRKEIAEAKTDLLKWMIVLFAPFYVGMIVFLLKQFVL